MGLYREKDSRRKDRSVQKARLVTKGYTQTYGVNYEETLSSVAKNNTVRILLSCATNRDWKVHQLDMKNAFLHEDLKEEVYMEIPSGLRMPIYWQGMPTETFSIWIGTIH